MKFADKVSGLKGTSRTMQIMRTVFSVLAPALFLVMLALPVAAQATSSGGTMKLPPFRKTKLPNGLTVLLMEKHNVPLVSFHMIVKTGSTADRYGLSRTMRNSSA